MFVLFSYSYIQAFIGAPEVLQLAACYIKARPQTKSLLAGFIFQVVQFQNLSKTPLCLNGLMTIKIKPFRK